LSVLLDSFVDIPETALPQDKGHIDRIPADLLDRHKDDLKTIGELILKILRQIIKLQFNGPNPCAEVS